MSKVKYRVFILSLIIPLVPQLIRLELVVDTTKILMLTLVTILVISFASFLLMKRKNKNLYSVGFGLGVGSAISFLLLIYRTWVLWMIWLPVLKRSFGS